MRLASFLRYDLASRAPPNELPTRFKEYLRLLREGHCCLGPWIYISLHWKGEFKHSGAVAARHSIHCLPMSPADLTAPAPNNDTASRSPPGRRSNIHPIPANPLHPTRSFPPLRTHALLALPRNPNTKNDTSCHDLHPKIQAEQP